MALVGRKVLVHYAVGGPRLWHERYVLAHVAGGYVHGGYAR